MGYALINALCIYIWLWSFRLQELSCISRERQRFPRSYFCWFGEHAKTHTSLFSFPQFPPSEPASCSSRCLLFFMMLPTEREKFDWLLSIVIWEKRKQGLYAATVDPQQITKAHIREKQGLQQAAIYTEKKTLKSERESCEKS